MRRKTWEKSSRALRTVLKDIAGTGATTNYKFGSVFVDRPGHYLIYNVMSDNVIATVRVTPEKYIIRYRPTSIYANILAQYQYEKPTVHAKSTRLRMYRSYARSMLRGQLRQEMDMRRQERAMARRSRVTHIAEFGEAVEPNSYGIPDRVAREMHNEVIERLRSDYASRMDTLYVPVNLEISE